MPTWLLALLLVTVAAGMLCAGYVMGLDRGFWRGLAHGRSEKHRCPECGATVEITDMLRGSWPTGEPGRGFASMSDDKMLCRECTRVADAAEGAAEPASV